MPQTPSKSSFRGKLIPAAAAVALVAVVLVVRCSKPVDVGSGPNVGAVTVDTQVVGGDGIKRISYRITGNEIATMAGGSDVNEARSSFVVKDVPAGQGYVVSLFALSRDGTVHCQQEQTFNVDAEKMTSMNITLTCVTRSPFRTVTPAHGEADAASYREVEVTPECHSCEQDGVKSGKCEPDSGCDGLVGNDLALCLDLVACARLSGCWVRHPGDCLCGTAGGVPCAKGEANGDCRREIQAATKTMDPILNGTRIYDPQYPAGRAMRLVACDFDACKDTCGPR